MATLRVEVLFWRCQDAKMETRRHVFYDVKEYFYMYSSLLYLHYSIFVIHTKYHKNLALCTLCFDKKKERKNCSTYIKTANKS